MTTAADHPRPHVSEVVAALDELVRRFDEHHANRDAAAATEAGRRADQMATNPEPEPPAA